MTSSLDSHKPQIISKAKEYAHTFNMPLDDLINQGVIIYYKSIKTYNPELSTYNTWLYINLKWILYAYCTTNRIDLAEFIDDEYLVGAFMGRGTKRASFSNMMIDLTPDSRQVVNIVLTQDRLPINMKKGNRLTQKTLKRYLSKVKRWKIRKIDCCFSEIKLALRDL